MSKVVLKLEDIKKSYGKGRTKVDVLKGVSLQVKQGEIVAVVGPSGCGKSTLLQIAGLLDQPNGGKITVGGEACTNKTSDGVRTRLRRQSLGFVYQFHHLLQEFSAEENVMLPQMIAGVRQKDAMVEAAHLLQRFGLRKRADHRPAQLSGGEQQRVAIARALINNPSLLLADEPTGNLDPGIAAEVFELLLEQAAQRELAVLIVTHNMELAKKAHRTVTLKEGVLAGK